MDLLIRKGMIDDAPAVAEVHCRSWEAAYAGIIPAEYIAMKNAQRPEQCRNNLSGNGSFDPVYVAVLDGRVVGFLGVGPTENEDLGDAFYEVYSLYLHPDVYRQGIGRQLMEFAHNLARAKGNSAKGKTSMALWVLEENTVARRFYEACGYQPDGAWEVVEYGKPLKSLRYRREL